MHGERMVGALSESIMVLWMDICVQFTCDAANSKDFCTFMKCDVVARSKGLCTFRLAIDFVHGRRMAGAWHKCKRKQTKMEYRRKRKMSKNRPFGHVSKFGK